MEKETRIPLGKGKGRRRRCRIGIKTFRQIVEGHISSDCEVHTEKKVGCFRGRGGGREDWLMINNQKLGGSSEIINSQKSILPSEKGGNHIGVMTSQKRLPLQEDFTGVRIEAT